MCPALTRFQECVVRAMDMVKEGLRKLRGNGFKAQEEKGAGLLCPRGSGIQLET